MKKGITAVSAAIMVAIIAIFVGAISITSYNSIQNAKKLVFAIEISEIQEEVTKYYDNSQDGIYPTTENEYTINLSALTSNALTQFNAETKTADNELTLYGIDLTTIGITDTTYGNLKTQKDVYVVSKETGRVYYLEGVKAGSKTYYTRTQDLIDIKERNEKEEEEISLELPNIYSDGLVERTLTDGTKEKYIANIEVKGNQIKTIKYEIGIIEEENAKSYFNNNGTTLIGDRIKLKEEAPVTIYAENSKGDFVIKYAGYPYIPKDFTASDIVTEDEVNEGLVIYDIPKNERDNVNWSATSQGNTTYLDVQEQYNQYVWIPVPDIRDFIPREGYENGAPQTYVTGGTSSEPYDRVYNSIKLSLTNDLTGEYAEYRAMKNSVNKYGGFYIARYEAGSETKRNTNVSNGTTTLVPSKKGAYVYNYIYWGKSMISIEDRIVDLENSETNDDYDQGSGAVTLSRSIYPKEESYDVVSTLCYGVEWDAVMYFMKDVENPNVEGKKYIEDATGMGWDRSKTSYYIAGKDIDEKASNMVKNIYDMMGNLNEYTMESLGTWSRVIRGGGTDKYDYVSTPSYRGSGGSWAASGVYGFRVALYIK